MAAKEVISQVKKKVRTTGGQVTYVDFPIGPELKYIGTLLSSNNNNLEEQLLLGTDRIVTEWRDKDDQDRDIDKVVVEFRRDSDENEYYILDTTDQTPSGGIIDGTVSVDGRTAHFENIMSYNNGRAVEREYNDWLWFEDNAINMTTKALMKEDVLKYKNSAGVEIPVATKKTHKSYIYREGVGSIKVIQESITNNLV